MRALRTLLRYASAPAAAAAELLAAALLAASMLMGCAATKEPPAEEAVRPPMDRILARMVFKGEFDRALHTADSLAGSKEPAEREMAAYWKSVTWLYRGEPDSALVILEALQGKWTGGLRKVHAGLFLGLAREASLNRAGGRLVRQEEPVRLLPTDPFWTAWTRSRRRTATCAPRPRGWPRKRKSTRSC